MRIDLRAGIPDPDRRFLNRAKNFVPKDPAKLPAVEVLAEDATSVTDSDAPDVLAQPQPVPHDFFGASGTGTAQPYPTARLLGSDKFRRALFRNCLSLRVYRHPRGVTVKGTNNANLPFPIDRLYLHPSKVSPFNPRNIQCHACMTRVCPSHCRHFRRTMEPNQRTLWTILVSPR